MSPTVSGLSSGSLRIAIVISTFRIVRYVAPSKGVSPEEEADILSKKRLEKWTT